MKMNLTNELSIITSNLESVLKQIEEIELKLKNISNESEAKKLIARYKKCNEELGVLKNKMEKIKELYETK